MCVGHDSALPALCEHQGGGVSAPYAGRNPSWRAPNAIVHFDYLYMGESAVDASIDAVDRFHYVLVILVDVSGYTWLRPSRACTANGTVQELVRW